MKNVALRPRRRALRHGTRLSSIVHALLFISCVTLGKSAHGDALQAYWADGYSGKMGVQTGIMPVISDDPRMSLGGMPLYVTGVTCYNLFVQCHEDDNMNTSLMEQTVRILATNEVPIVRFSCSPYYASQLHFYTDQKEKYLANLDRLGDLCDQYRILLIPSVFWNVECLTDYFSEHISQWGNTESKTYKFMQEYTRDVVNTLKRHKCLAAWEFGNEFNLKADIGIAGWPLITAAQVGVAYKGFAETVRANDSEGRMICTGNSVMRNSQWHQYHDQNWNTDSFDEYVEITGIQTPSPMTGMSEHVFEDKRSFSDLGDNLSRTQQVAYAKKCAARNGKVYYVGEFTGPGSDGGTDEAIEAHYRAYLDQKVQLSLMWNYALNGNIEHSFTAESAAGRMVFGLVRTYNAKLAQVQEIKGCSVTIPESWATNYPTFKATFGSDFTAALTKTTNKFDAEGKPMYVWQDFVAGTDPTDENSVFKAHLTMVEDKPVVTCSPELSEAEKAKRKYVIWGNEKLQCENWVAVPRGNEDDYNFFRMTVEMK